MARRVVYVERRPSWAALAFLGLARLVWRTLRGTAVSVAWLTLTAGAVLQWTVRGRWRAQIAPAWVALAACLVSRWGAWALAGIWVAAWPWTWTGLARLARRLRRHPPRRFLSKRETRLVAGAFAAVSFWHLCGSVVPGFAFAWWWPALIVAPFAVFWWRWRRVLPRRVPKIIEHWRTQITEGDPAVVGSLAGTTLVDVEDVRETPEGYEGDATLALPHGVVPSAVTTKDELAEHLLARVDPQIVAGTVQIGRHPSRSPLHVRVRFVPVRNGDVIRYFQEPSFNPSTGLYLGGYAHSTAPSDSAILRSGGVLHRAFIAATGGGKSGEERLLAVEAALSPLVLLIVFDGKRGTGIPSVRDGAAFYARTPEQWRDAQFTIDQMRLARMARYGDLGRDRFTPRPGDPVILALKDEWPTIHASNGMHLVSSLNTTREGRSLGFADAYAMQKGDAYGWGDIGIRNNVYGGGEVWVGTAGDGAAAGVASQDYGVDFSLIPGQPGWGARLIKVDGHASGETRRTLWIPSQSDVEDGADAPFGRVEDWAAEALRQGTVHAALDPSEAVWMDRLIHGDPTLTEDAQDAASDAEKAARTLVLDRVLVYLLLVEREHGQDMGAQRGEIAGKVGASAGHTSSVLAKAIADGLVHQPVEYGPYFLTPQGREIAEDRATAVMDELEVV